MAKKIAFIMTCLLVSVSMAFAGSFKISGAGTVYSDFVQKNIAAVEKAAGVKLEITSSNTGKGLVDLMEGRVQLSMVSEPLEIALDAAKAAGKVIDPSAVKLHEIKQSELVFVVNKANTVSTLNKEQLKGIMTGKIKNWKEVGGADAPITVFTDAPNSGTCALVKKTVNDGEEFGSTRKPLDAIAKVARNVSDFKNGIGPVAPNFASDFGVKVVDVGMKVTRPLGFFSKGEASGEAAKVLEAFKAVAK